VDEETSKTDLAKKKLANSPYMMVASCARSSKLEFSILYSVALPHGFIVPGCRTRFRGILDRILLTVAVLVGAESVSYARSVVKQSVFLVPAGHGHGRN
jgi:hypothetical protein